MYTKNSYIIALLSLTAILTMLLSGCVEENIILEDSCETVYYGYTDQGITKTYLGSDFEVLWHPADSVSIFAGQTTNSCYKVTSGGNTGEAVFQIVSSGGQSSYPIKLDANYAVYPYSSETSMSSDGIISYVFPEEQIYSKSGFARGTSPMVAVTPDLAADAFTFSNLCGILNFRLQGSGIVKRIVLSGNSDERLSGRADVRASFSSAPIVEMTEDSGTSILLDCGSGVKLSSVSPTDFWFVIPPTVFTQGFEISAYDVSGKVMNCRMSQSVSVPRNVIQSLAPVSYEPEYEDGFVHFNDDKFEKFCLDNYDLDKDRRISEEEALNVTDMEVATDEIGDVFGINWFKNLRNLSLPGAEINHGDGSYSIYSALKNVDLDLPDLQTLHFYGGVSSLDITGCPNLEWLSVYGTRIRDIDLSSCKKLKYLNAGSTNLTSIDITSCPELEDLDLTFCWDMSSFEYCLNTSLENLSVSYTNLTYLDLTNFPNLRSFTCHSWVKEMEIDFTGLEHLSFLDIRSTPIKVLDISSIHNLSYVDCSICSSLKYILVSDDFNPSYFEHDPSAIILTANVLDVSDPDTAASGSGGVTVLNVMSITDCEVTDVPDWITVQDCSRTDRFTHKIALLVDKNETGSARSGIVKVANEAGSTDEVTIIQKAFNQSSDWTTAEFMHRSLIMRFTATWCKYCPKMARAISDAQESYPDRLEVMNVHWSDEYSIDECNTLNDYYYISSYPSGIFDGFQRVEFLSDEKELSRSIIALYDKNHSEYETNTGISFSSSIVNGSLCVDVSTYIKKKGEYRITAVLLEDGIIGHQKGGLQSDYGYQHDGVPRAFLTKAVGDDFSTTEANSVRSMNFSHSIPDSVNIDNCRILIYIQTNTADGWRVDNCISSKVGQNVSLQLENQSTGGGNEDIIPGTDIPF